MNTAFLVGIVFLFQVAMANQWTDQKPLRGVVRGFDKRCVTIKGADGKIFKLKRNLFKDVQMLSGKTEIGYFSASIEANRCDEDRFNTEK